MKTAAFIVGLAAVVCFLLSYQQKKRNGKCAFRNIDIQFTDPESSENTGRQEHDESHQTAAKQKKFKLFFQIIIARSLLFQRKGLAG